MQFKRGARDGLATRRDPSTVGDPDGRNFDNLLKGAPMRDNAEYSRTFEAHGHPFKLEVFHDAHAPAPWEMSDGHGPVRQVNRRDPGRDGELYLSVPSYGAGWIYDMEEARRIAIRDKWGTADGNRDGESLTAYACRAAREDYKYLQAWVNNEWHYVGVCVTHEASGAHSSVWGIESTDTDFYLTTANDLAHECIADPAFKAWRERIAACERALDVCGYAVDVVARCLERDGHPLTGKQLREAFALLRTLEAEGFLHSVQHDPTLA
jgi:hypothetical protein